MNPRRTRPPRPAATMAGEARRIFLEEYRFLREGNMSHQQIARTLGITLTVLQARILRYDCLILSDAEQRISDRLDELISRHEPFTLEQISSLDDGTAQLLVKIALKRGRIRVSRSAQTRPRKPPVYVATTMGRS